MEELVLLRDQVEELVAENEQQREMLRTTSIELMKSVDLRSLVSVASALSQPHQPPPELQLATAPGPAPHLTRLLCGAVAGFTACGGLLAWPPVPGALAGAALSAVAAARPYAPGSSPFKREEEAAEEARLVRAGVPRAAAAVSVGGGQVEGGPWVVTACASASAASLALAAQLLSRLALGAEGVATAWDGGAVALCLWWLLRAAWGAWAGARAAAEVRAARGRLVAACARVRSPLGARDGTSAALLAGARGGLPRLLSVFAFAEAAAVARVRRGATALTLAALALVALAPACVGGESHGWGGPQWRWAVAAAARGREAARAAGFQLPLALLRPEQLAFLALFAADAAVVGA
jgi:hypothetical protein